MNQLMEITRKLMLTPGISGYEAEVAKIMLDELRPCSDELHKDRSGNVVSLIKGADKTAPKVMLVAHMDQIGMIVTRVCEDGYIRITKNGSVPDKILPGSHLIVKGIDGTYTPAAVAVKSYHAMSEQEKLRVDPVTEVYVDIGASSRKEVNDKGIYVGCPVQYKPSFTKLAGSRIAGTAIDNRLSCALIILCARHLYRSRPDCSVYTVGTVQEEHNLRGGMIAAKTIEPDIAICLDVSLDSSQLGLEDVLENVIGTGPTIGMYSFHGRGTLNGTIAHAGLASLAQESADENGIRINRFAMRGILSDSTYVQLGSSEGVACLDMGIPVRYIHSPMEICDMKDAEALFTVLCTMIKKIDRDFDCSRF